MTIPTIALLGYLVGAAAPLSAAAIFAYRAKRSARQAAFDLARLPVLADEIREAKGQEVLLSSANKAGFQDPNGLLGQFVPNEDRATVMSAESAIEEKLKRLNAEQDSIFARNGLEPTTYGNLPIAPVSVLTVLAKQSSRRYVAEFIVLSVGVIGSLVAGIVTIPSGQ